MPHKKALGIKSFICTEFSMFNNFFRVYVIETELDFVSFDDKNLQRVKTTKNCWRT